MDSVLSVMRTPKNGRNHLVVVIAENWTFASALAIYTGVQCVVWLHFGCPGLVITVKCFVVTFFPIIIIKIGLSRCQQPLVRNENESRWRYRDRKRHRQSGGVLIISVSYTHFYNVLRPFQFHGRHRHNVVLSVETCDEDISLPPTPPHRSTCCNRWRRLSISSTALRRVTAWKRKAKWVSKYRSKQSDAKP